MMKALEAVTLVLLVGVEIVILNIYASPFLITRGDWCM